MSTSREINHKLFLHRELHITYNPYEDEMSFYEAVKNANLEVVQQEMEHFKRETTKGKGVLSDNPVRNLLYHFIISTAMVARFCIGGGMDHDMAYSLSDLYIQKADRCKTIDELKLLQQDMAYDYCRRMKQLQKASVYSKQIVLAIDYIYDNLHKKITVKSIANAIGINETYLSKLFKRETGVSVSEYIRLRRIEAAKNMLMYSDYSYADISSYLCFSSQSHFTKIFRSETGYTPKVFRDRNFRRTFGGERDEILPD